MSITILSTMNTSIETMANNSNTLSNTSGISGVIVSVFGVLSTNQVAVFIGVVITILTFLLSLWRFKKEEKQREFDNKLKQELHDAKLKALACGINVDD